MTTLYHFECPVCGYDDEEAKALAPAEEIDCPLCLEDCAHFNRLIKWEAIDGKTREEARQLERSTP